MDFRAFVDELITLCIKHRVKLAASEIGGSPEITLAELTGEINETLFSWVAARSAAPEDGASDSTPSSAEAA